MKKLTMLVALAAFAVGQIAWADTAAVVAQAKKTADEMFAANSGATISESFGKVSKAYSQWKADQLAEVGKTLKFGPWWVSHAIDKRRFKDVVNGIDPTVHPLDKEAAFDNLKLWRTFDIPDGVMTNLRINDWIYRNIVSFIYREIESSKDQTVYFTILPKKNPVYLNGELVCKADDKRPDYVELKLKKGVNRLVVRMESPGGKRPNRYRAPDGEQFPRQARDIRPREQADIEPDSVHAQFALQRGSDGRDYGKLYSPPRHVFGRRD